MSLRNFYEKAIPGQGKRKSKGSEMKAYLVMLKRSWLGVKQERGQRRSRAHGMSDLERLCNMRSYLEGMNKREKSVDLSF